ncbi:MAG: hypothetical protein JWO05_1227 [Gemmatimonadetes bacterium]|nr:hypothetical protein [Gemmatimonadota bacterium]
MTRAFTRSVIGCLGAVLLLSPAPRLGAQGATPGARGEITGRVIERVSRNPVPRASLIVESTGATVPTDSAGRFELRGLVPGSYPIRVRAMGYSTVSRTLLVPAGDGVPQLFELEAIELAPVITRERENQLTRRYAEFEARRQNGKGHFLTREEIDATHLTTVTDLLGLVPGITRVCDSEGCIPRFSRAFRHCAPQVFVDGREQAFFGWKIATQDIYGMEIYNGLATTPPEYLTERAQCGTVVIWTRAAP